MSRLDLALIKPYIKDESRVLDLGCGNGELLEILKRDKNINGLGIEIDAINITDCIARGISIVEHDLDLGLGRFANNSFDTVVMSQALQSLRHPNFVLSEMLRVGAQAIITFPNFGHWRSRWHLSCLGKMPVSKFMPYTWYNTPNIHFCTVNDFDTLCEQENIQVLDRSFIGANNKKGPLSNSLPNLFSITAIYHVTKTT